MVCHQYKVIFIHVPKTAGQSVEHLFLDLLGLTWKTRAPLLLGINKRPEIGPPRLAHLKAEDYVRYKYLSQEVFDEYFKFSIVRNPWSRMVSLYKYLGFDIKQKFKPFLFNIYKKRPILDEKRWFVGSQASFICDEKGEIIVDFVGRFENLQQDFNSICRQIGLSPTKLPHVNKSKQGHLEINWKPKVFAKHVFYKVKNKVIPEYSRYQDYYDAESRELVAELYYKDIELFNYEFE